MYTRTEGRGGQAIHCQGVEAVVLLADDRVLAGQGAPTGRYVVVDADDLNHIVHSQGIAVHGIVELGDAAAVLRLRRLMGTRADTSRAHAIVIC